MNPQRDALPVIDVGPLVDGLASRHHVAEEIGRACREVGFFYVVGHGIEESLQHDLESASRRFFALELERKMSIRMARAGRAWRGYFPVGDELTSGKPDQKEGLYFGEELGAEHPRVRAGTPLFGANLFPEELPELRALVLETMRRLTGLGHALMAGIAISLGLDEQYFASRYTRNPFVLFRIFHYPPLGTTEPAAPLWSVGEHTDYGLLTILRQDDVGGLQVRTSAGWVEAPPIPDSFVCNIGDMLDRMTAGRYRSTPHRVRNRSERSRLSFPFFFDPDFDAQVRPIEGIGPAVDDRDQRWDQASVHELSGTYGDYLLAKVARVFPRLLENAP